jgi:hypothetical protein
MFLLKIQIDGHGTVLFTKLYSPSAFPAACSRGCQPRVRTFADQVSLKLRERAKDVKHQLAARCGRIDRFGDTLESDPLSLLTCTSQRRMEPMSPPGYRCVPSTVTGGTFS